MEEHDKIVASMNAAGKLMARNQEFLQDILDAANDCLDEYKKQVELEELKQAAKKLGYKLVKDPGPVPKRLPCTCGCTRVYKAILYGETSSGWETHMLCRACNRGIVVPSRDIRKKNLAWNAWVMSQKGE